MGIFTKNRTSNIGLDVSSTAVKLLEFGKEFVDNEPFEEQRKQAHVRAG